MTLSSQLLMGKLTTKHESMIILTGSQPPGWESILGGFASSLLTRGRASKNTFPAWRLGTRLHERAFELFLVPFPQSPLPLIPSP